MMTKQGAEGWKRERGEASLSDVHRTIPVDPQAKSWRKAAAVVGPGGGNDRATITFAVV